MKWKTHRDQLSVMVLLGIFALIVLNLATQIGYGVGIPDMLWGFLIGVGNYVIIFYFRKKGEEQINEKP